jgi:hypothetical protein
MTILLRHPGGDWQPTDPRAYINEEELQRLLKSSPEIIPCTPPDLPGIVYCREFPVGSYAIDLVGVGSDGTISLIECKLARNLEAKRTVVGQVLEYAASVWRMDPSTFERAYKSRNGQSPFEELRDKGIDGWDEAQCRDQVADNLERGRFRLMIAVDEARPELRSIIDYVNHQPGDLYLVALELPYFMGGPVEVLVPETYGDELVAAHQEPRDRTRAPQSLEEFFASYPDAKKPHELISNVLLPLPPSRYGISYRSRDGGPWVMQLFLPDHRIYFNRTEIEKVGKLAELIASAQRAGFSATTTGIEWPNHSGEQMDAFLGFLDTNCLALFR